MFSVLQSARNQNLPVHIILELYQTTILPIYGCEIWGYEKLTILESCNMNVLGDEFHFVMECSRYIPIFDNKFLPPKCTLVKSMFNLCNLFSASRNIQLKFAKLILSGNVT